MRVAIAIVLLSLFDSTANGQVNPNYHWVEGYYQQDGTYVQGHYATDPNYTNRDNYSTYPNVNPWTGQQGTVAPDNNLPNQPQQSGTVNYSRSSGGDPIWVASSGQVPYGAMMQQRRVLTPAEQAAREAARQARRDRAAASRDLRRHHAHLRAMERKAKAALRKKERAAKAQ